MDVSTKTSDADSKLLHMKDEFLRRNRAFYYMPVSLQQSKTTIDRPARGPFWVSRATFPAVAGPAIIDAVTQAIKDFGSGGEVFDKPTVRDVKMQWTGNRRGASSKDSEPNIDEREKYRHLKEDVASNIVIYYFHGGFFYTGGSAAARVVTQPLSRALGGRVVSLDYRLSPQNPFPAALVDALVGYLSLLYPPPDAFHKPIKPEQIVFAGDSGGGCIAASLLLLIQNIHNKNSGCIEHEGRKLPVPMPAGYAGISSYFDNSSSHDYTEANLKYDFLVPERPYMSDQTRSCSIWPSQPPRGEIHCETSMLSHPLVSPMIAQSWRLFPPMFLVYGEDNAGHQGAFVANRALRDGVVVQFHHYEHQVHAFPTMWPNFGPSKHVIRQMAEFAQQCIKDRNSLTSRKIRHPPTVDAVEDIELDVNFPDEDFEERLAKMRAVQAARKPWTGAKSKSVL